MPEAMELEYGGNPFLLGYKLEDRKEGVDGSEQIQRLIKELYQHRAPEKLANLDDLMIKYVGREHALYQALCERYNYSSRLRDPPVGETGDGVAALTAHQPPVSGDVVAALTVHTSPSRDELDEKNSA